MKLYIDTHNKTAGTFPDGIGKAEFAEFYKKFVACCEEEGVVSFRGHIGLNEGKAFCFTMAPNVESVKRAHDKAGLPYDSIVEVTTVTPGDMFAA